MRATSPLHLDPLHCPLQNGHGGGQGGMDNTVGLPRLSVSEMERMTPVPLASCTLRKSIMKNKVSRQNMSHWPTGHELKSELGIPEIRAKHFRLLVLTMVA